MLLSALNKKKKIIKMLSFNLLCICVHLILIINGAYSFQEDILSIFSGNNKLFLLILFIFINKK